MIGHLEASDHRVCDQSGPKMTKNDHFGPFWGHFGSILGQKLHVVGWLGEVGFAALADALEGRWWAQKMS